MEIAISFFCLNFAKKKRELTHTLDIATRYIILAYNPKEFEEEVGQVAIQGPVSDS